MTSETFHDRDEGVDDGWWDLMRRIDAEAESLDVDERPDTGLTVDDVVVRLVRIRDLRQRLADRAADMEKLLLSMEPPKKFVVAGVGEVQVRKSMTRTDWDNEGLTRVLVALALDERIVDEATGEYEPGWEAVARVLSECARPLWRVTPLRARGIDESEFCHVEPGHQSIQLPAKG